MMIRLLAVLALAPLLLAPVRLQDSNPNFFGGGSASSPAPESYSLPPAGPLVTPTVVYVSPTVLPEVSVTLPPSLNLPQGPKGQPPVVIQQIYMSPEQSNVMPFKHAALCQRAMLLAQDMAMLSYQQKQSPNVFKFATIASVGVGQATNQRWPSMKSFNDAADDLPWFYPYKAEVNQAVSAVQSLCARR